MTLTNSACGQDLRWDALDQRWDRWTTCADGRAIALRALTTYHQFFGQVDERTYRCSPSTQFRPADDRRGTTFGGRCAADGAEAVLAGVVVGVETVTIGGRPVPTLHVRVDERLTGATRGSRTSESWYALGSNLLVKRTSLTDADTKATFGSTHYREHLTLQLASTTPRR
jgi:hypothetical protein